MSGRASGATLKDEAKATFPGTPSSKGLTTSQPNAGGFAPKTPDPAPLHQASDDTGTAPDGIPTTGTEQAAAAGGDVPAAAFSKRTSPGTPEAKSVLKEEPDPGVSDWLWAVSFDSEADREMTFKEVVAAFEAGEIDAETIVWREGMDDWLPLREVEEFQSVAGVRSSLDGDDTESEVAPVGGPASDGGAPASGFNLADALEDIDDDDLDPPADSREAWRRSTADLLAELSLGKDAPAGVGANPIASALGSLEASDPPRPAVPSLRPSLIPPRGPARIIVFVLVGVVVLFAITGVVVLVVYGLRSEPDPTLLAPGPSARRPQGEQLQGSASPEPSAAATPHSSAEAGSASADLASAVSAHMGPGEPEDPEGPKFDRNTAERKLAEAAHRASACRPKNSDDQQGPARVAVTFDPASGGVSRVQLLGRYAGTQTGNCIELTMKSLHLRNFTGPPVTIEQAVMVR